MPATTLSRTILLVALTLALTSAAPAAAPGTSRPQSVLTVSASQVVRGPTGTIGSATAHCPRGTRAISGGYDSTFRAGALLPFASIRSGPRSWRVPPTGSPEAAAN